MTGLIESVVKGNKQEAAEPPSVRKMEGFLRKKFPVKKDQVLRVAHLWAENFRVNLYDIERPHDSALSFHRMKWSKFVRVVVKKSKMKCEEFTD